MKKHILHLTILLLVGLLLPLPAPAQVVDIPDPNLRAAIERALNKAQGETITATEMATLMELNARDASITDLTGLEFATNLTTLRLHNNHITDISELSTLSLLRGLFLDNNNIADISELSGLIQLEVLGLGGNRITDISELSDLTNLTRLRLGHNHISDLSPLVANTGLGSGDQLEVQGNPLSYKSIKTHIPTLKSRGVTVDVDDLTDLNVGEPLMVRLVHFLPSDRFPQQGIDTKLDALIRDVQQFYADEMQRHGFGRKTFTFETDATGKAVVHHIEGQFTDSYYRQNTFHKVWEEIRQQFHTPQNIYFIAIDIGNERVGRGYDEACGVGESHGASGGHVLIPATGDCFNLKTAAHELGHAFGLHHDFRNGSYIMSLGRDPNKLSECAAEWLAAHPYFNTAQDQPYSDNPTNFEMLTPFASPPYAIGLRFQVTDPDGVHQAQLLTPSTLRAQELWHPKLLNCQRLNGETGTITIEFITNLLFTTNRTPAQSNEVILNVIDLKGNSTSQTYQIDVNSILSTETASTPDRNQTFNIPEPVPPPFSVREAFELDPFYKQWIDVEGFPILASEKVSPYALKEAAWLIRQMIGHRPDVIEVLVQQRVRFVVIGHTEILTDIPEYSDHLPDFLSYRFRGLGGSGLSGHPAVSSSEENLLHYSGEGLYNVFIHEFAHVIHRFGLNMIDPTFDDRLQIAYNAAMAKGLWQGTYASSERREYWAEATQTWFYPHGTSSFYRFGNTRQALKAYDPNLAALLAEIYGDDDWRYTPLATRTHLPHLQGFDPQDTPTYHGFPELEELFRQFRNPNSDGGNNWVDLTPYDPSLLPSLNESRTHGPYVMVGFINLTDADVFVYPVAPNGTARLWTRIDPGRIRPTVAIANEIWLIKDLNGRDLALFQAVEKAGRILIDDALNLITSGLSKISGDNQSGVPGAVLASPFVIEARDGNGSALTGLSVTFAVTAGGGMLSVTNIMTDENGRAESTLTLGPNLGTNTVEVSAAGIEGTVTFSVVVETAVDIPDPNLRAAIETALGKASGASITADEMATLTELNARDASITDLTGLEFATNLTTLRLHNNRITDISELSSLTHLKGLFLDNNDIADISPLSNLIQLEVLGLGGNRITDISILSRLTLLIRLRLDRNNITDLSPLVANTGLGSGDQLEIQGNLLSHTSIKTHIPALQSRGVTVEFDHQTPTVPDGNAGDFAGRVYVPGPLPQVTRDGAQPIAGVTVTIMSGPRSGESTVTDAAGQYLFQNIDEDELHLLAEKDGFEPKEVIVHRFEPTILADGAVPGYRKDVQKTPGNILIGHVWPEEIRFILKETLVVHDLLYIDAGTPPEGRNIGGLYDKGTIAVYTNLYANHSDPKATLLRVLAHEIAHAHQHAQASVEGMFNTRAWLDTPEAEAFREARRKDWEEVGKVRYDSIPGWESDLENAAETCSYYWSVNRWGALRHYGKLEEVAPNRFKWAQEWVGPKPPMLEYVWSMPASINLIHVPLRVTEVDGAAKTIESIADLYDTLGGADAVNFLITYDSQAQEWRSYFSASDRGTPADRTLTNDMGIIAGMIAPISIHLRGTALGTDGRSTFTLNQGLNLVGIPLRDEGIARVSDLFTLDGIGGNVPLIILTDDGEFKLVSRAGDPGDIRVIGGQGFILTAQQAAQVTISGEGWTNPSGAAAAPLVALKGIEVTDTTPVLALRGAVVDEGAGLTGNRLRVIVKNLSTGKAITGLTSGEAAAYRLTVVDTETARAAMIGDVLEVLARSTNPRIGVKPLRYTVTADDVRRSLIELPELVIYEIPVETQLMANYPNPFNPETWIPYRLAEDAFVTLTIYDLTGQVVRTLDVGHRIAAIYENRSKAIYWDGRNRFGEQVASGVYFYHLSAGDYSATRKMLIIK